MPDLLVRPRGHEHFTLRYENWQRRAKVPVLVLNATTLNTGHNWQFTATWMGEPPSATDERVDASRRLRRVYYGDAPGDDLKRPSLGKAVAASASVPGIFAPITLKRLYDDVDVELVDGGVHDNQGVASLIEQDCTVILASDASGQMQDADDPQRWFVRVLLRTNSILMKRVRGSEYGELRSRVRSNTLRGFMNVHLTKGLPAQPRDWSKCQEPWEPLDDPGPAAAELPYGIDDKVQRALAELRTDLDSFTDEEAYALMAAGYLMTSADLGEALPALEWPAPGAGVDWPFAAVQARMTSGHEEEALERSLRRGAKLFLRGPRARWSRWWNGV
jgi:hypothetical protein